MELPVLDAAGSDHAGRCGLHTYSSGAVGVAAPVEHKSSVHCSTVVVDIGKLCLTLVGDQSSPLLSQSEALTSWPWLPMFNWSSSRTEIDNTCP